MGKLAIVALLACVFPLWAQDCISAPCSGSTNFSFDLNTGNPSGEIQTGPLTFYPPPGYAVRILHVKGVFTAWIIAGLPRGASSGILFGLTNSAVSSENAYPLSDHCPLFIQDVFADSSKVQDAFDYDTSAGGLLDASNVLTLTVASFMNLQGVKIHAEPTFVVTYRWEKR